jgi:hypothetical protein
MLLVWKTFTAFVRASRIVAVTCEKCHARFFYELTRIGVGRGRAPYLIGQGSAADRAAASAQKDLAKRLEGEAELVPCPKCQWVNEDAIARYRRRKYRHATRFATGIVVAGLVLAWGELYIDGRPFPSAPMQVMLAACLLSAAAVLVLRQWRPRRIDPNRSLADSPILPPGTPPALVERLDSRSGQSHLEPIVGKPKEAAHTSDWVVLRADQDTFPSVCCMCLGDATTWYDSPFKVNQYSEIAVPLCESCSSQLRKRWWGVAVFTACLTLVVAALAALAIPGPDALGRWMIILLFGPLASLIVATVVPNIICRPYRFSAVDADRGVARFAAKNPAYNTLLAEHLLEADARVTRYGPFGCTVDRLAIPLPGHGTVAEAPPSYQVTYGVGRKPGRN